MCVRQEHVTKAKCDSDLSCKRMNMSVKYNTEVPLPYVDETPSFHKIQSVTIVVHKMSKS